MDALPLAEEETVRILIPCCLWCFVKALFTREMWQKLPEPRAIIVKEKR